MVYFLEFRTGQKKNSELVKLDYMFKQLTTGRIESSSNTQQTYLLGNEKQCSGKSINFVFLLKILGFFFPAYQLWIERDKFYFKQIL